MRIECLGVHFLGTQENNLNLTDTVGFWREQSAYRLKEIKSKERKKRRVWGSWWGIEKRTIPLVKSIRTLKECWLSADICPCQYPLLSHPFSRIMTLSNLFANDTLPLICHTLKTPPEAFMSASALTLASFSQQPPIDRQLLAGYLCCFLSSKNTSLFPCLSLSQFFLFLKGVRALVEISLCSFLADFGFFSPSVALEVCNAMWLQWDISVKTPHPKQL